jgi:glycosyltransferase involved in cell wall biosynthesis
VKILIVYPGKIPVTLYGGTQRVIWYLGEELVKLGHKVTYLVKEGSYCDFAQIIFIDDKKQITEQIPGSTDIIHFNFTPQNVDSVSIPYVITIHRNRNENLQLNKNSIFISKNHANRYGSDTFVYNGLNWDDYFVPDFKQKKDYFHFLGNAAWRVKNVKGAIGIIKKTKKERLKVLGGYRFNFKMGLRFTFSPRVSFYGMVGGDRKNRLINDSKGLIFPVRWHEPFGLGLIESLYYGCPVFGTPYGSLPEIVIKDVGFLSDNLNSLANAVENSSSYSYRWCHEYAVGKFNSKKMAESYLEYYKKVMNGEILNKELPQLKEKEKTGFLEWIS